MYKSYSELGAQPEKNTDQFSVVEIANGQHKNQIISENRVVVIDIYADWCGPCRQIAPDYSVLGAKYNKVGECILVKENLEKKLTPGITGVPSFHFIVEGRKVDEVVGGDLEAVEAKLLQILQGGAGNQSNVGPQYSRSALRNHGPVGHGQTIPETYSQPQQSYSQQTGPMYHQYQ
uniref:Thioredoxin domain-containing protein n=1 Tax=viral metagenome TaxID=1070528 RepID=A0A6C0EPP3_9ZZZZ